MADDDNKKPINGSNTPINGQDKLARIEDRRASAQGDYTDEQMRLERSKQEKEAVYQSRVAEFAAATDQSNTGIPYKRLEAQAERVEQAKYKFDTFEQDYANKVNSAAASEIITHTKYDNVNARTTTKSSNVRFSDEIRKDQSLLQVPTQVLEERIQSRQEKISDLGRQLAQETRGLSYGGYSDEAKQKSNTINELEESVALDKHLQKAQNKAGMSTEKRRESTNEIISKADKISGRESLKQDVAGGKYGSYESELKKLTDMTAKVVKTQEAWDSSLSNSTDANYKLTDEYKSLTSEVDKAKKDLSDQTDIVGEVKRQGGGPSRLDNYMKVATGVQYAGHKVANIASNINNMYSNQDMTQMGNRAAFASLGNQMYDKANKAVMGDDVDAAMDLLTTPQFAKQYADRNRKSAHAAGWTGAIAKAPGNIMVEGGIGVGVGMAVGGGLAALAAPFTGGASLAAAPAMMAWGAGIGGGIGAVSATTDSMSEMTNLSYGNVGAAASLASIDKVQALSDQSRYVKTRQMQKYYSQNLNTYQGGMGLGNSQSKGMQELLTNKTMLSALADTGVGAEDAVQMSSMLKSAGNFGGANNGIDIIANAGRAGQHGQMSREDYMGAASRMVGAGGHDDDLQDIITKGMENAKNINQMVDASVQLSSGLTSLGISGVGTTSKMLSASVGEYKAMGMNENLATGAAATSLKNLSNKFTSSSMTFGNIMETAELRRTKGLENAHPLQMNKVRDLSLEEIGVLRAGGKDAENLADRKGIKGLIYDEDGKQKSGVINGIARAALRASIVDTGGVEFADEIVRKSEAKESLSDKEKAVMANLGSDQSAAKRVFHSDFENKDKKKQEKMNGIDAEKFKKQREATEIDGGKEFAQGLNKMNSAFNNIEGMMKLVNESIDPKEFSKTINKAAQSFEQPVADFGSHLEKTFGAKGTLKKVLSEHVAVLAMMGEGRAPTKIPSKPKD